MTSFMLGSSQGRRAGLLRAGSLRPCPTHEEQRTPRRCIEREDGCRDGGRSGGGGKEGLSGEVGSLSQFREGQDDGWSGESRVVKRKRRERPRRRVMAHKREDARLRFDWTADG